MPLDDVSDTAVDRYECGKRSVKLCLQDNSGCTESGNQVQNINLRGTYVDLQLTTINEVDGFEVNVYADEFS